MPLRAGADGLREELRGQGIRMFGVFPGRTGSPMQVQVLAADDRTAPRRRTDGVGAGLRQDA